MTNVSSRRNAGVVSMAWVFLLAMAGSLHAAELPDFVSLVEKNAPAIVNVQATVTPSAIAQDLGPDADGQQEIPEIFRRFFGPIPRGGQPEGERRSAGSGFIISSDGYVLTNNHVVGEADQVTVRLSDRREFDARVIGTDEQTDIALLKIEASSLPVVSIGDSTLLKPGQWVVAVGSPFGMDHTVTHGIVSAVGRGYDRSQQYVPFIQTDVPINPGNSGGPLFNLDGQVVGINSQIFSNTGGYMGVSFAIPISVAMNTVGQLKEKGHVSRGMIGVQIQNVDRASAKALGLPRSGGALVNNVSPGGAAEKAGVKVGDVILGFDGSEVVSSSDLPPMVGLTPPGTKSELEIFRNGKTMKVPVVVGELPQDASAVASTAPRAAPANKLGVVVEDLTAEQRQQLGLKDEGVVITRIAGAAARRAALQPGDVVLMIGRKSVKSAADFNAAVKDLKPDESVMLLIRRNDTTSFVALTVPKSDDE
ncbi:DegQ family serine endoprotease [Dokdonella immobilis]|uniref:Probable periplasmic serine endoprotease DegP-like n=1 Tax=Dokdonella immobilis TaxID=578942 RepID=A0A1I4VW61_9GAMM|nr:DegQ family serine endoprotease [Dokdonella immobilis]SFN05504.1 serine protease Do [Dokdonella immobilis]